MTLGCVVECLLWDFGDTLCDELSLRTHFRNGLLMRLNRSVE